MRIVVRQLNHGVIPNKLGAGLWLIIFALTFAWRIQNLNAFGLSNDEGVYLMWARLVADGYPLYSETYAVQPPLFIESLALAFRLAGQTIQAGRWAMLIGYILLAVSLSWLAYRSGGWWGALGALVLLSLSPLVFAYSRLAMAEVPATALAVTAIAALLRYGEKGKRGWLVASGLILGLSFITKALNPFLGFLGVLLLFLYHRQGQRWPGQAFLVDLMLWGLAVVIPVAAIFVVYKPGAAYDQLVAFRGDLRAAIPGSWSETWALFELFIYSHWGFWLLAFGGIISAVLRAWEPGAGAGHKIGETFLFYNFIWIAWLLAGVALVWWHTPLFFHHLIVLLPPLILLGAGLLPSLIGLWTKPGGSLLGRIILVLVLLGSLFYVPAAVKANQETMTIVTGGREQEALRFLEAISSPDDFLMGDSQLLIFMAGRRTPPPLGDVALVGIKAGRQTSERMIALSRAYQAPAVVQWSLRLPWLPEYLEWVQANYLARRVWDNDHLIYFVQRVPAGQAIPNERRTRLGDALFLRGYHFDEASVQPGQPLNLKIYWQSEQKLAQNYTVFVQLLDEQGQFVAGYDSQPLGGFFPTGEWPTHEVITDVLPLPLPADLPPGTYTLITGMYLLETLERLPVDDPSKDYIVLTSLEIR